MAFSRKKEVVSDNETDLRGAAPCGRTGPETSSDINKYYRDPVPARDRDMSVTRACRGLQLIAAGLSGLLACTNVRAADLPGTAAKTDGAIPAESALTEPQTAYSASSASDSGQKDLEREVTDRWGLDPEDLPEEEETASPEIPEDLVPYFREWTGLAAGTYGQDLPPASDLGKYSPRADALRAGVKEKAEKRLRRETGKIERALREFASSAGPAALVQMTASLQKADHRDGPTAADRDSENPKTGDFPLQNGSGKPDPDGPEARNISSVAQFLGERADNIRLSDRQQDAPEANGESGEDPFSRLIRMYSPLQWEVLPVPPLLSDFKIRFPSDVHRMETKHGRKLVPGLSNYLLSPDLFPAKPSDPLSADNVKEGERDGREPNLLLREKDPEDPAQGAGTALISAETGEETGETGSSSDEAASQVSRRLVLVGDSRTVGMRMHVVSDENVYWSAADSMGYNWMVSKGVPAVEDRIEENTDVVFLMGVNDLGNVGKYADYMSQKAGEWKERGARTFFVSVNPVDDRRSPNAKNSRIESFNSYMRDNLSDVYYIDSYSRIRHSFGSPDGIHFNGSTYQEIYRIIRFAIYRGWYEESGLRFYFNCGRPLTGWQYLDGKWQYFDGNGVLWIRDSRVGDICLAPYPETGLLNPYEAVWHEDIE